ncbi:uncharacterized protein EI90DRAFT_3151417 [Cantharellus anzutake]|uniref:uncharacterized protein n=1 Tax=Cantharellus anzutake TaxID=1750568 RepID=UPI0019042467|nr:uncharacterized protein EI90DRAFT_3151417 [Cantharellus anzutake]KAF8338721.1 hypothetical protein EI90DRAFT_3151417 [Cantharellus anzutake]
MSIQLEVFPLNPGSHTPNLAGSLNNLFPNQDRTPRIWPGHSTADVILGQHWRRSHPSSVKLWRQLFAVNPGSYTLPLTQEHTPRIGNITQQSIYCSFGPRTALGLPFIEKSINLRHQLVAVNPESYTPYLAILLHNQYLALSNLGRHSKALPFIEECVNIRAPAITQEHILQNWPTHSRTNVMLFRISDVIPRHKWFTFERKVESDIRLAKSDLNF